MYGMKLGEVSIEQILSALATVLGLLIAVVLGIQGDGSSHPAPPASETTVTSSIAPVPSSTAPAPTPTSTTAAPTPTSTTAAPTMIPDWPSLDNREKLVAESLERRGNQIGTGGKPAIALRFDHYLGQFGTNVLPLLEQHRIPWSQAINSSTVNTRKDPWTWNQLAEAAHTTGGEIWNHSRTHQNFATKEDAYSEVVGGLNDLHENLPTLRIDGWIAPGVTDAMGMQWPASMSRYTDTYPGRLVLDNHTFVRASFPGVLHPLDGTRLIGQTHYGIEDKTFPQIKHKIDEAVETGSGLTLMMHPWRVGTSTGISHADLESTIEYLAQLRDEDRIEIASGTGILMAQANQPEHVNNLLDVPEEGEINGQVVSTISDLQRTGGVIHEAEAWVTGAGNATIRVEVDSPTHPLTVEFTGELTDAPTRLSVVLTPPSDATATRVSIIGGSTYSGWSYQPI